MVFVQQQYNYLSGHFPESGWQAQLFQNNEIDIILHQKVALCDVFIVGSLTAPPKQALCLLRLIQTICMQGPKSITLFSPYWGYQRQDKTGGLFWADAMLKAAGVTSLVVVEPHNMSVASSLSLPVKKVSSFSLFFHEVKKFVHQGFSFVFTDIGGQRRSYEIFDMYPSVKMGYFTKKRDFLDVELTSFEGSVSKQVIIFDDILDSGQTLLKTCLALKQMQVQDIVVIVTHAFFHTEIWNELWAMGVKKILCTDSLPHAREVDHPNIQIVSILPLLKEHILD